MNKPKVSDWKRRFDNQFEIIKKAGLPDNCSLDDVKDFISQEIHTAQIELLEKTKEAINTHMKVMPKPSVTQWGQGLTEGSTYITGAELVVTFANLKQELEKKRNEMKTVVLKKATRYGWFLTIGDDIVKHTWAVTSLELLTLKKVIEDNLEEIKEEIKL